MKRKRVLSVIVLTLLMLLFVVPSVSVLGQGPSISVNPSSGDPGSGVNLTGSGFVPNTPCDVSFGNYGTLANFVTDPNGGGNANFSVPNQASPGPTPVVVNCSSQQTASTSFTVNQPPPPTNPPPLPTKTCQELQNCTPVPPQPTKTCQQLQNCTPTPSSTPAGTLTPSATPLQTPTPTPTSPPTATLTLTGTPVLPTAIAVTGTKPGFFDKIFAFLIPPSPTPTPSTLDLEVVKVEFTQAIQCIDNPDCKDNSTPLFTGKPTMVRAYVRINSGPASVPNISGILCNQWYTDAPAVCIRPVSAITVYKVSDPVAAWRGDMRYTLNFILPPGWTSKPGWQNFLFQVNYKMEDVKECPGCDSNNRAYKSAFVMTSRTLNIVFVQIKYKGVWSGDSPKWGIVDWLKRVYPTSDIGVWKLPVGIVTGANLNEAGSSDKPCGGWSDLLDELSWLKDHTTGGGDKYFYGMVASSAGPFSAGGCGRYPDSPPVVSAGTVSNPGRYDGKHAAHELGHNMNRAHTPGCGAGRPDSGYPLALGNLDDTGIDILLSQVYKNTMSFDIMSYCGGEADTWISSYTYRALIGAMGYPAIGYTPGDKVLASIRSDTTMDYLVGSGYISPTSIDIRHGFYRLALVPDPAYNITSGAYTAELQDAAGKTLSTLIFIPGKEDDMPTDSGPFHIRIPWIEGGKTIVFKYNGAEIGRRQASAGTPVVTLTSPNGGENWGQAGGQIITWNASDPDGDKLSYIVDYSRDNGVTWETLAANLQETQLAIEDVSAFAGSNAALIRVTASDGFNTAWDVSDENFSVVDKGPEVHITSPTQGVTVPYGSPLILWGIGTDPQDGPLGESAFTWSSNRDGALGSGSLLVNQTLSVGEHILTLTGRDANGLSAAESVTVVVTGAENSAGQPPLNARNIPWYVWSIVAVGIILAGILVLLQVRKNRKQG
jgi:hypothetical protein